MAGFGWPPCPAGGSGVQTVTGRRPCREFPCPGSQHDSQRCGEAVGAFGYVLLKSALSFRRQPGRALKSSPGTPNPVEFIKDALSTSPLRAVSTELSARGLHPPESRGMG